MNERIRELEKQSYITFKDENSFDCLVFSKEKFAELIILECVQQCESLADIAENINSGEMARKTKATAQSCGKMIKLRFGVE